MKYSKAPLTQADVHAAVKLGISTRNYGKLVTDMYLPALSTSLQLDQSLDKCTWILCSPAY